MFGFLNIDKPQRMTSRDVVNLIQPLVRPHKIGHAGTLDPLATGVLVIGIGYATRLFPYLSRLAKTYRASFRFGWRSDTDDVEGNVEEVTGPMLGAEEIAKAVSRWRGEVRQVPPAFSAVKVTGRRAYELARRGQPVQLEPKTVVIHGLEVVQYSYPDITLDIECSSGTYVRSLGRDIAADLQTSAVMTSLVRTSVGPFPLESAVSLDRVLNEPLEQALLPPQTALPMLPRVELTESQVADITCGRAIVLERSPAHAREIAAYDERESLVAILVPAGADRWRPERCFRQ